MLCWRIRCLLAWIIANIIFIFISLDDNLHNIWLFLEVLKGEWGCQRGFSADFFQPWVGLFLVLVHPYRLLYFRKEMKLLSWLLSATTLLGVLSDNSWKPADECSTQMQNAAQSDIALCSKCRRIAIVDASVAGLTAALERSLAGHNVSKFMKLVIVLVVIQIPDRIRCNMVVTWRTHARSNLYSTIPDFKTRSHTFTLVLFRVPVFCGMMQRYPCLKKLIYLDSINHSIILSVAMIC